MKHLFFCQSTVNVGYILLYIDKQIKTEDYFTIVLYEPLKYLESFLEKALQDRFTYRIIIVPKVKDDFKILNPLSWVKTRKNLIKVSGKYFNKFEHDNIVFFERNFDFTTFYFVGLFNRISEINYVSIDIREKTEDFTLYHNSFKTLLYVFVINSIFKIKINYVKYCGRLIPQLNLKKYDVKSTDWSERQNDIIEIYRRYSDLSNINLSNKKIIWLDDSRFQKINLDKKFYYQKIENIFDFILKHISKDEILIKPHPNAKISDFFNNNKFSILPSDFSAEFIPYNDKIIILSVWSSALIGLSNLGFKCIFLYYIFVEEKDNKILPFLKYIKDYGNNILTPKSFKELADIISLHGKVVIDEKNSDNI